MKNNKLVGLCEHPNVIKLIEHIINILFGISTACLTFMLIEQKGTYNIIYVILPLLSFAISQILVYKFKFLKNTFKDVNIIALGISIILGIYTSLYTYGIAKYKVFIEQIFICSIIAIPAISVFLYWFYKKLIYYMKKYIKSLDKIEKNYLAITITILTISVLVIYNITNLFYKSVICEDKYDYWILDSNTGQRIEDEKLENIIYNDIIDKIYKNHHYDTVYTSDTGGLYVQDVFSNIVAGENNYRQPFFGLFSVPFCIIPRLISDALPFENNVYGVLCAIVQGVLILISFTLLSRLMKLKGIEKGLFLTTLTISYPTLLFLLNLEQYCIPTFYVIAYIYMSLNKIDEDKNMMYVASTGSMLTSGILFPLLGKHKDLKQSIKNIFYTFCLFIAILIVSARITLFLPSNLAGAINDIKRFSVSEYSTIEKFNMYTNFLQNNYFFTSFEIDNHTLGEFGLKVENTFVNIIFNGPSIHGLNTTKFSTVGIVVLILAILGFALNRKDAFSIVSFVWVIFSFVLLFVLGWGTQEDGLILYILYYSWAFVSLMYKLLERLLKNHKRLKESIYIAIIIVMAIVNIYGIYEIIKFGLEYFKC